MDVANKRDQSYQYDVSKSFVVDAKHFGNEARFVNRKFYRNFGAIVNVGFITVQLG